MIALLTRNLPNPQEEHFAWRHFANPAGEAWSWFLCEEPGGSAVGMASVFPRPMSVDGRQEIWGQVGEFVVDAKYRSLGPALMLQRATFEPVKAGDVPVCYDCPPHDQGMSTFDRLGMRANTEVYRYALPLRSDEFLEKRLGNGILFKPAVVSANLALGIKLFRRGKPQMHGIEVSELGGDFGQEFTQLDQSVSSLGAIWASRSAEQLNWRHRRQPHCSFRTLVARRSGELLAFLTSIDFAGRVAIWDLFGRHVEDVGAVLIDALISSSRKEKAHLVEGYCSGDNGLRDLFNKMGFSPRERLARIVAYGTQACRRDLTAGPGPRWAFTLTEPGLA
jgi:hypothetical protein